MSDFQQTGPPIHFYWFSGSGNTLLAVEAFAQRARELGRTVVLRPIETSDPEQVDPAAVFGIAFPTHFFSIPPIVRSFVRAIPRVDGPPAIFLGTHGAFSGGVCGPMKRLLRQRGFRCVAGRIFSFPDSFWPIFGTETNRRHILRADERVRGYADFCTNALASGTISWPRLPILSDLHGLFFGTIFALRKWAGPLHTTTRVRRSQCTRCGRCVRTCPVQALSQSTPDATPRANLRCTNCLRCVAICPNDAMRHLIGFSPYRCESATELKERFKRELDQ